MNNSNLGPTYLDERHRGILSRMEDFYAQSVSINQAFWQEADIDTRMEAGDQSVFGEMYGTVPSVRPRNYAFNRIRRIINVTGGFQRRNRKSTSVIPIENGDDVTADQFTKIMMWINQHEGVLETVSESFHGALVTGMNLLHVWVDYRTDPVSGNIKVDNCSYNSFLIDPFFRKSDLSDCNGIWKRTFLTKRECLALIPDKEEEIMGLQGNDTGSGKFQFMPETYNYTMKNLLAYDEFYFRDYRKQKLLMDAKTGETIEWKSNNQDALDEFLQKYPSVSVIETEVPTVNLAIVIQNRVMYLGPQPNGGSDLYPFVPVFAYYNPQMPYYPERVQGMVRNLRDAQYLYNRRKIIELDILESQVTSGWKYKEGTLINPKDVFLTGQGRGIALKRDAQMTDAEQIISPSLQPGVIELSKILGEEITQISGANEELIGSATDDKAGVLSMLRQGAGLTSLQMLFDQLDRSQKLLGNVILDLVQRNFTPGKVQKILNGEQPSPQFYNKAFGRYGCAIEEGFNTTTQKQQQFAQLLQLKELGVPVPDSILIEAATLQDKKKLIEAIQQSQQQQQQQMEKQMDIQMREAESRIELAKASAVANQGLGLERVSRVEENKALSVERIAEAQKDKETAFLTLVKALKEIDEIDLNHLEKLITLTHTLKDRELTAQTPQITPEGNNG